MSENIVDTLDHYEIITNQAMNVKRVRTKLSVLYSKRIRVSVAGLNPFAYFRTRIP